MTRVPLQVRDRFETPITCDFVHLPEMPLTVSGEIDRKRLLRGNVDRQSTESVAPRNEFERQLASLWQEVLEVPLLGIDENFFELGGTSIKAMRLINQLQAKISQILHPTALFEAPTIAKLVVYLNEHYPELNAQLQGTIITPKPSQNLQSNQKINPSQVTQMRQFYLEKMSGKMLSQDAQSPKNPQAIFVLCPGRSGSTLLRVILAGHPQLFAPPELYLLSFDTLQEKKAACSGGSSFMLEGAIRALMEIKGISLTEAESMMSELEEKNLTAKHFYGLIQEWLSDKILVDKTPYYALSQNVLSRAEAFFENPLYIHLLRHPVPTINSLEEMRVDLLEPDNSGKMSFSARETAELMWQISHQNIREFLEDIPTHRQYRVKYEDLVKQPQTTVAGLCQFLGMDLHPDMLQPYKEKKKRMSDGLHSVSRMIGDPKFHTHKSIDPQAADRWKQNYTVDFLSEETWQLAEFLGYERISLMDDEREEEEF